MKNLITILLLITSINVFSEETVDRDAYVSMMLADINKKTDTLKRAYEYSTECLVDVRTQTRLKKLSSKNIKSITKSIASCQTFFILYEESKEVYDFIENHKNDDFSPIAPSTLAMWLSYINLASDNIHELCLLDDTYSGSCQ